MGGVITSHGAFLMISLELGYRAIGGKERLGAGYYQVTIYWRRSSDLTQFDRLKEIGSSLD